MVDMTLLLFFGNHMICMNCAYLESSLIALTLIKMTKNDKNKNDNFRQFIQVLVFCFLGGFLSIFKNYITVLFM